ncbi:MAG: CBS domain-containing protein, partial [Bdellovibrionales bacterium]|nr:CBS domain-containing protein [Bdellovibrionales bacterium]
HELGHLFVQSIFGQFPRSIRFYPFGAVTNFSMGLAQTSKFSEELLTRVAGPVVTIGIMNLVSFFLGSATGIGASLLEQLYHFNGLVLLFSLLPIFPLDMFPVVLKALRTTKQPSKLSFTISQWLAVFILVLAIFQRDELIMLFSATLLLLTVKEQLYQRAYVMAQKLTVREVMSRPSELFCLQHGDRVEKHFEEIVRTYQPYIPVVHGSRYVGIVSRDEAIQLMVDGDDHYVSEAFEPRPLQVQVSTPLAEVLELLTKEHRDFAIVLKEEAFEGLITKEKISEFLLISHLVEQAKHASSAVDIDNDF